MAGETQVIIQGGELINDSFSALDTAVTIWATKLDFNLDKPIINIEEIRQLSQLDDEPDSTLVDLGRIKRVITIQGFLIDETTESAFTKKENLINSIYKRIAIQISWGTGARAKTFVGNITKCMITETPGIIGEQQSGYECEKNFAVQLSLIIGTDIQG